MCVCVCVCVCVVQLLSWSRSFYNAPPATRQVEGKRKDNDNGELYHQHTQDHQVQQFCLFKFVFVLPSVLTVRVLVHMKSSSCGQAA